MARIDLETLEKGRQAMNKKDTEALMRFADKHDCMKGCTGCIGESDEGCNHPDHPLMNKPRGQDVCTAEAVAAHV